MPLLSSAALAAAALSSHPAPTHRFDALAFFAGPTEGIGRLKKLLSASERTVVHGHGTIRGDTLVLDQTVVEGSKPAKSREWHIREIAPGRYLGTLTDASGAVRGESVGNRLHLSFTMKGGLPTEQWLTLAPDGRSAHNVMRVKKLGVTVATLTEEIRKTG